MVRIVIVTLIYMFIAYISQCLIHEAGHLLFGKLSGYRFLSFRIYGVVIYRNGKKLLVRVDQGAGSVGQCLMTPPDRENYPFALITLGGCIFNAITALVAVTVLLSPINIATVNKIGLGLYTFFGLSFALMNIIPIRTAECMNDGLVFNDLLKNLIAKECNKKQLNMIPALVEGKSYGEIPYNMFKMPDDADVSNAIVGYSKILECYHFMDLGDWEKAKSCLNCFFEKLDKLPVMIRNIVLAEDLFIRIRIGDSTVKESGIYENISNYLRRTSRDFNAVRVRIVYDMIFGQEKSDKKKIHKELDRLNKNYLYQGEAKFCRYLINEIL